MFWYVLLAMAGYGFVHSLLATAGLKQLVKSVLGARAFEGFYRLIYNSIGALTFIPVGLLVMVAPFRTIWTIPAPWATGLLLVQAIATFALIVAVLQADPLRFAGISQALAYIQGKTLPLPAEPLQTGGMYALVRHPLYLFSMLVVWPMPTMTDSFLGFAVGATLYFVIGLKFEERRLLNEFGEDYRQYKQQVPALLPWPRPNMG